MAGGVGLTASAPLRLAVMQGTHTVRLRLDGLQVSAAGALRGFKDTRVPMLISLVSYWGVGLSSGALLAFVFGLGGQGLWVGLVLGLAAAAVLLVGRFGRLNRGRTGSSWL